MRELFAAVPESRARGYEAGRFSFNVKGGRCEACQGDGVIKRGDALPARRVRALRCLQGQALQPRDLGDPLQGQEHPGGARHDGRGCAAVLRRTVPTISQKLQTLIDVGLSYVRLGQSATTLSGGEAQRVKLAKELSKRATGRTLYILDEPTTGLHFADIAQLLRCCTACAMRAIPWS
jgi:excinuclease ABC subunit A